MGTSERGFTLIELMVVVLIIGILVSIAIPLFDAAKSHAQQKSCFANQRTIEGAAQSYNASYTALPPSGLVDGGMPGLVGTSAYIKATPYCPTSHTEYHISLSGSIDGDNGNVTWIHVHY